MGDLGGENETPAAEAGRARSHARKARFRELWKAGCVGALIDEPERAAFIVEAIALGRPVRLDDEPAVSVEIGERIRDGLRAEPDEADDRHVLHVDRRAEMEREGGIAARLFRGD